MSQWGAQPGYQYPLQTGFQPPNPQFQQQNSQFQPQNPQFQQQNPQFQQFQQQNASLPQPGSFGTGGLVSQPTGFPAQRLQGFQQPQQTGFAGSGFIQAQPTGFPQGGFQARQAPPPPPVPPLPTQFQRQNQGPNILPQQQVAPASRFLGPSPAMSTPSLIPQQTGFVGRSGIGPLVSQPTGFVDPRLQMMTNTFMPVNGPSFGGVTPQVAPPQYDLQQSFQQHTQLQRGTSTPQMSWALSKAEKKQYNDIFRSWDAQSTGFISGQTALEVFGASGLPKDDLARIWTLADIDDRGKLNIAEFHVAMGLIYRRLSGMPVPDKLPAELVPPSARDLDNSVDIVKDLLKYESRTPGADTPVSRLKNRSFNTTGSAIDSGRDATIYKHSDSEPPGGFYQPRSRHVNRDDVRSGNDSDSPAADLSDLKRRLASTADMLERAAEADASRTAEDEELDREMDDLKYRVKRVSDDLEYVSRGPRTAAKDQERRQLERELLTLMHEKVPEVERKIKVRDERKEREKRQWARDRDRANDRFGRYDERDRDRPYSRGAFDRDRPYSRGAYDRDDRDRPYSRGALDRDERDRDRDRDERDYGRDSYRREERPRSPPASRAAPPPPSAAPPTSTHDHPSPAPPKPSPSPSLKNMTPDERRALAREEAKRLIEARKLALGVTVPSSASPVIDTSVEDRLQREKKEAEEKARIADQQAEEREKIRKQRLESEKAARETKTPPPAPTPTRVVPAPTAPAPAPIPKTAPPTPKRAPAPPPPRKASAARPAFSAAPPAPKPPVVPAPPPQPELDPEEEALRAREDAIRKQREARAERLRQLEKEEEEAAQKDEEERRLAKVREERAEKLRQMKQAEEEERLEEERYQERLNALKAKTVPPSAAPASAFFAPEPAAPLPPTAPSPPPPVPAQLPKPVTPSADTAKSTNPFSRLIGQTGTASLAASPTTTASNGSTNPWARPQTAPPPSIPNPSKSPVPAAVKTSYHTAPSSATDDDWDDIKENESGDDSSDDDFSGRSKRENIARQLFGGIIPAGGPQSTDIKTQSSPSTPTPPAPPPPPPPGAPPPPAASSAPAFSPPVTSAPEDRSGLLSSIQAGLKLRPAKTVDKSGPPGAGKVLGDTAPPLHINAAPRSASPLSPTRRPQPTPMAHDDPSSISSNRQSVSWFADRAADVGVEVQRLPSTLEEEEEEKAEPASIPTVHVDEAKGDGVSDIMADIDKTITHRVRTLYQFIGDGPDDLSFDDNLVIIANPSKSGGDWWYGTLVSSGRSGVFPKTYVEVVKQVKAKALYSYASGGSDEIPFSEGDQLIIIDTSEEEWWKTEQGGVVFIVPAAYLEIVEDTTTPDARASKSSSADKMALTKPDADPSLSDGSRTSESLRHQETSSNILGESGDEGSDTELDSSDYLSFDESEEENVHPETKAERVARAHERQLVLEAAGLIVTQHDKPPPALVRARSYKRRPAPLAPPKRPLSTSVKDLPPTPEVTLNSEPEIIDHAQRLDDAFDRYESFKNSQRSSNRMSSASNMSVEAYPPSPTISITPSREREGEGKTYSQFLSFLGRNRTPEEKERSVNKLNISAPIIQGLGDSDISRVGTPAFGSSWTSLVDRTALEGIPVGERRRQEAIFELINTESTYVRDLQLIVEIFYSSMLPLLSQKEVTVVFANVEDILLLNTAFLSSLEDRQKECRLYVDKIGDILLNHIPNLVGYMEYCVNHNTAIKVLKSLRDSNLNLAAHLQRLRDDPVVRNLDLSSYLLVPMQRITRYPLLIKQILSHTEAPDERENVQSALVTSEKLLDHINEAIRDQEGSETLKNISQNLWIGQGRLDLSAPTRHMGPRKLIKEGALIKAKSGRKLYGYLCSDILVLTDATLKTLYKMPIPLAQARVRDTYPGRESSTFQISQAYPRGGDSIALKAPSVQVCQSWMQEIEYASRRCRHAEDRAAARKAKKQ